MKCPVCKHKKVYGYVWVDGKTKRYLYCPKCGGGKK